MITDIENCSAQQLQSQINYLLETPVKGVAVNLLCGLCSLKKGNVRSLSWLGDLKTEFGQIGHLSPDAGKGQRKFRVREVVPLLRANPGVDARLLRAIEDFVKKDELGEVEYNVTLYYDGSELVMKDGDKRTIAFYERRKDLGDDTIQYPVFIVSRLAST
jgi:hypothetical protein